MYTFLRIETYLTCIENNTFWMPHIKFRYTNHNQEIEKGKKTGRDVENRIGSGVRHPYLPPIDHNTPCPEMSVHMVSTTNTNCLSNL